MLDLRNRTPFAAALVPGLDREGRGNVTVIVKGTFDLGGSAAALPVAEQQVPVVHADTFFGEPGRSSLRYEADACPAKRGTDVVLIGHAYPARGRAASLDVTLRAGRLRKVVRVIGDRVWERSLGRLRIGEPVPFSKVPLVYERAFGGADRSDPDPAKHAGERRNPLGTGFSLSDHGQHLEGLALPNLEDPEAPITKPTDRPPPAGFGFIGRDWLPRAAFAGTYDALWQSERCPFLPEDFDERYHNGAHPDLTASHLFRGGEPVEVSGASERGDLRFSVPSRPLEVAVRIKGRVQPSPLGLDTLRIEPDERRLVLTWRATVPCGRDFLYIDSLRVTETRAGA